MEKLSGVGGDSGIQAVARPMHYVSSRPVERIDQNQEARHQTPQPRPTQHWPGRG